MVKEKFTFQNLQVWDKAIQFANEVIRLAAQIKTARNHFRLIEQLESSAASVAANIAEGKGRYSKKEFIQYLYIARGSLFETITFLTVFKANGWIDDKNYANLLDMAEEISKMLSSLISNIRKTVN